MFLAREQDLSPDAVLEAVLSFPLSGGHNATYEGEYGEDEYHVFRVSFSDMPSVCLRVERARREDDQTILDRAEAERRTYERLGEVDFHWSTRLVGASLTFDNPIRYPFLLLDFAGETRLEWSAVSPPQPARAGLLARLATIQLELIECTLETREMTAYEYFEQKIHCRLKQIREGKLPELVEQDVLDQLALLPQVLGDDKDNTQFALEHGDLNAESIISSGQQFIIEAIVDWGSAQMVPIAQAARLPPLLRSGADADDDDDMPRETLLKDRALYIAGYADRALSAPAAAAMKRAQTGANVDFRTMYLESIKSESVLTAMARVGWTLPYSKLHGED